MRNLAAIELLKSDIEPLRERLKRENNRGERLVLQRLLFQRMYKIGVSRELIDYIDDEIAEWKNWLERQRSGVQRLEAAGRENRLERNLLLLAQQTIVLHELHRQRLLRIVAMDTDAHAGPANGQKNAKAPESTSKRFAPT